MMACYSCKKEITSSDIHYKAGKAFCSHCWGHAVEHAAELGLELKEKK